MKKTINELKIGEVAKIIGVSGVNSALRRRLLDMGLTANIPVEIIRFAPFGDPVEIKVRGYALTIRKDDAKLVEVA